MSNDKKSWDFPEFEQKMIKKVLREHYLTKQVCNEANVDIEDLEQELFMIVLNEREQWDAIKEKSKTTTLMYIRLQQRATTLFDKLLYRDAYYSNLNEVDTYGYILRCIKDGTGKVADYYNTLKDEIKEEILEKVEAVVASKNTRTHIKIKAGKVYTAERRLKNMAKKQMFIIDLDNEKRGK